MSAAPEIARHDWFSELAMLANESFRRHVPEPIAAQLAQGVALRVRAEFGGLNVLISQGSDLGRPEGSHTRKKLCDILHLAGQVLMAHGLDGDAAAAALDNLGTRLRATWGHVGAIYISMDLRAALAARDERLYNEFNGSNVLELARKYQVSQQHVYRIVKRQSRLLIARRQPDLFEPRQCDAFE